MKIDEYLSANQKMLISCRPEDAVTSAAIMLATNNIGAMPVIDEKGRLVGIVSERDIVRAFARANNEIMKILVSEIMSRNPITCTRDDTMESAMVIMNRHRFRHLPVMDGEDLVGLISIGDTLVEMLHAKELEANVMRDISIASRVR